MTAAKFKPLILSEELVARKLVNRTHKRGRADGARSGPIGTVNRKTALSGPRNYFPLQDGSETRRKCVYFYGHHLVLCHKMRT
jgi:hypothetical protein